MPKINLVIEEGINYVDIILRITYIIVSTYGISTSMLSLDNNMAILWLLSMFYCIEAGKLRYKIYNIYNKGDR